MQRISQVRLPRPIESFEGNSLWDIFINNERVVEAIRPIQNYTDSPVENWNGDWISPMGVDLQINGGLGISFSEITFKNLPKFLSLLDRLWLDGVEAICPTIVSCPLSELHKSLLVFREARELNRPGRANLLGAHLEGPFIQYQKKGAHFLKYICRPSLSALNDRLRGFEEEIALMTLAPELPSSNLLINRLKKLGVIVSIGHTSATAEICKHAFANGAGMLTHAFNAMDGLGHREPGPIGAALMHGNIAIGLIADGVHVHPDIAVLLQRLASGKIVLVSDALSAYGFEDGQYQWDQRVIQVKNATCRLEDSTLAGTTLSLLEGCRRLAHWGKQPSASIFSGTIAPRRVLNLKKSFNEYIIGKPLQSLLRWSWDSNLSQLTWQKAA